MASASAFRAIGKEFGIINVMVTLFQAKTPLTTENLRVYLNNSSILSALKKINDLPNLDITYIKAIFRIAETYSGRKYSLNEYLTELVSLASSKEVSQVTLTLSTDGSNVESAYKMLDDMARIHGSVPAAPEPEPAPDASSLVAEATPEPSAASTAATSKPKITRKPRPVATPSVASAASALTSSTLTSAAPSALTSSTLTSAAPSSLTSAASSLTSVASSLTEIEIGKGFKIHVKDDMLNTSKYEAGILDIDSCKDIIYPVAIDLSPGATYRDILTYVAKVLTEASAKNLKCHTALHVYTIKSWNSTDRVTYLKI